MSVWIMPIQNHNMFTRLTWYLECKYLSDRSKFIDTLHVYVVIHFRDSDVFLSGSESVQIFSLSALLLEIQWPRKGGRGDPINQVNPIIFMSLSQARTCIFNAMCCGLLKLFFMFNVFRQEVVVHFVDIGGIVDRHCLNFLLIAHATGCTITTVNCMEIHCTAISSR